MKVVLRSKRNESEANRRYLVHAGAVTQADNMFTFDGCT